MPRFRYSSKHGDLIGAHLSTKGGLHTVFERAAAINASALALFAKNSNQWKGKELTDDDCALFQKMRTVHPVFTHASYLINLATTNPDFHRKSIAALTDDFIEAMSEDFEEYEEYEEEEDEGEDEEEYEEDDEGEDDYDEEEEAEEDEGVSHNGNRPPR